MGGRGSSSGKVARNEKEIKIRSDNLPELTGLEKQVAWANKIRDDYINLLNKALEENHVGVEQIESAYSHSIIEGLGGKKSATRQQSEGNINKLVEKANEAKKAAKATAKQQGKSKDEITIAGAKAESTICTPIYKKWVESDLQEWTRAADWIDAHKFNTLDVPINRALSVAVSRINTKKRLGLE